MANLFNRTPVYTSATDVKDTTSKTALASEDDATVVLLICQAEDLIDTYIRSYGEPADEDQDLIFPVLDDDGNSLLPRDITLATFYTVEQLYESGDTITGATSTGSGAISSEKVGDHTVSYDVGTSTTNSNLKLLGIPPQAEALLKKYKQTFYKATI